MPARNRQARATIQTGALLKLVGEFVKRFR